MALVDSHAALSTLLYSGLLFAELLSVAAAAAALFGLALFGLILFFASIVAKGSEEISPDPNRVPPFPTE
jgi:hypothetical protein